MQYLDDVMALLQTVITAYEDMLFLAFVILIVFTISYHIKRLMVDHL